jgi:uncharacterized protein YbaR (Trm112 family)
MVDEVLGVTTCPTCRKRFRILKKQESFIGKAISCPKCNRSFVIELETPAPIERAAMANSSTNGQTDSAEHAEEKSAAKAKRRSKAEVRKANLARMKTDFRPFMKRLEAISCSDSKTEEVVRVWCIDILRSVLGYKDEDIDLELSALGDRIDIALKHEGNVVLIIECKGIDNKLPAKARDQAVKYAATKNASWAVVTSGQNWSLYRVLPIKGQDPRPVEVFNIALLDDDGLSNYDLTRLYLLTKQALIRGETEKEFHLAQCLDPKHLFNAMLSDRAVTAIRRSLIEAYRKEFKQHVKLTTKDILEELKGLIRPEDL